jgi:FkbM family methyltransferase
VHPRLKELAKKLRVYESARRVSDEVKWSKTFESVYNLTHWDSRRAKQNELNLFRSLVPAGSLCFDVGANIGDKTNIYLKHQCRVLSIEPVARNIEILHKRFKQTSRVTILTAAVSDHVGSAPINVIDDNTAFSSFNKRWIESLEDKTLNRWGFSVKPPSVEIVKTTTLDLLIEEFGSPFYIKVDVEGHEINVLRGLTRTVPLVSIEANLPEFIDETKECLSTLSALAPASVFNYTNEEPDRFRLTEWVSAADFTTWLDTTDARFMEIFCRMP